MAQICLLLIALIVALSAFIRHSGVGLGCADWPACYGQELSLVQAGEAIAVADDVAFARSAHRLVASTALLLVIAMVFVSFTARPTLRREGALALALLVLALGLAALGIVTPGSRLPAVTLGNLLGGFGMLAVCARLIAVTGAHRPRDTALTRTASVVAILLIVQIALGALVSATHAGMSCHSLNECTAFTAEHGWNFASLDPWRAPSLDSTALVSAAAGAPVQWAHRVGALVITASILVLGVLALRSGRQRSALGLAGLLLAVAALGAILSVENLPLTAVLLHNMGAAGLLAMVLRLGVTTGVTRT